MRIDSFIICEDIRNEIGGKQSLMGVFGDSIILEVPPVAKDQWPKALRLGIFVQLGLEENDQSINNLAFKIERITVDVPEKIVEGMIPVWKNKGLGRLSIAFVQNPFLITGVGSVTLKLTCFKDDGKMISLQNNSLKVRIDQKVSSPQ